MALLFNDSAIDRFPRGDVVSFSGADIRAVIHRPAYRTGSLAYGGQNPSAINNKDSVTHDLGAIQTLSISTFRSKKEVRSLGFQHVMGYARGSRTIGGHLVFALLEKHPFNETGSSTHANGVLDNSSGFLNKEGLDSGQFIAGGQQLDTEEGNQFVAPAPGDPPAYVHDYSLYKKHQYDFTWDSQRWGETMYVDELPPFDIVITFANEAGNNGIIEIYGVEIQEEGMTLSIEDLFTEVTYSYTARGAKLFNEGTFKVRGDNRYKSAHADDFALASLKGNGERASSFFDSFRDGWNDFVSGD